MTLRREEQHSSSISFYPGYIKELKKVLKGGRKGEVENLYSTKLFEITEKFN